MNRCSLFILLILIAVGLFFTGITPRMSATPLSPQIPSVIDFSNVRVGAQNRNSFLIQNIGKDSLLVFQIIPPLSKEYRLTIPELPVILDTLQSITITVELRARDTGCALDYILVVTDVGVDTITLQRCASVSQTLPNLHYALKFDDTEVNYCSQKSLQAASIEMPTLRLFDIKSKGQGEEAFHCTVVIPYEGVPLFQEPPQSLPFEFCPKQDGTYQTQFECVTNLGIFLIDMVGSTPSGKVATSHFYHLDSTGGHVGDTLTLHLLVDPPLTIADGVDSIDINLDFNLNALVLQDIQLGVISNEQDIVLIHAEAISETDRIQIVSTIGFLTGRELLRLKFVGLSTGLPQNRVRITGTSSSPETIGSTGLISLEGCTLGTSGFGRRVSVQSLTLNPSGTEVILHYTAPEGARGEAAIIDAAGTEVSRFQLQPGNDASQEWRLPLVGFTPGLYGLLIQVADDYVIVPFISPR